MTRMCLVSIVAGVLTWVGAAPSELTVRVGDEFGVRASVEPEVTQIGEDGAVIASATPSPPYVFEYKYVKDMIAYTRAGEGVIAEYSDIPDSPYGKVRVETTNPECFVYFRALKMTGPVKLPTQAATANGVSLDVVNDSTLVVNPRKATLRISIEAIQLD